MNETIKKMLAKNRDAVTTAAISETEKQIGRKVTGDELRTIYESKTLDLDSGDGVPTYGGVLASYHSAYFTGVKHSHDFFEMSFVMSGTVTRRSFAIKTSKRRSIVVRRNLRARFPSEISANPRARLSNFFWANSRCRIVRKR